MLRVLTGQPRSMCLSRCLAVTWAEDPREGTRAACLNLFGRLLDKVMRRKMYKS